MREEFNLDTETIQYFQQRLLKWYHKNKRKLPWREEPTPYHVWVSEIMLQQTRVEAVREYYSRFIQRLPDIESLANVDDAELYKLWEGLGYYNRVKNLKKTAQILLSDYRGKLPSSYKELLKLPGIGSYTAGAIASIAFSERVPAVDGNVMRVMARIIGDYRDITQSATKKDMERIVQDILPQKDIQSFNQAMMEIGAVVCVPNGFPKCEECPVPLICYSYRNKVQEELPVKKSKKDRKKEQRTLLIFMNEKKEFLIQKRAPKGLLAGLWEFVSVKESLSVKEVKNLLSFYQIPYIKIHEIEETKHIFSHIEWFMKGYLLEGDYSNLMTIFERDFEQRLTVREKEYESFSYIEFTEEQAWSDLESLKNVYSIPAAFQAYIKSMEKGMISEVLNQESTSESENFLIDK